jgi:hypothetical protein
VTDCSGDFRPRMRIAGAGFGVRARARVGRLNCRFGAVGNTCRCFATLTFPLDEFLGLASEACAWHCFAIRSQRSAPLPLSRNATPCNSLGCQSEVTSQSAFAESQRDGMCEAADGRRSCDRLRPGIPRQRRGLDAFSTTDEHWGKRISKRRRSYREAASRGVVDRPSIACISGCKTPRIRRRKHL